MAQPGKHRVTGNWHDLLVYQFRTHKCLNIDIRYATVSAVQTYIWYGNRYNTSHTTNVVPTHQLLCLESLKFDNLN